jgi:hypothetical protein
MNVLFMETAARDVNCEKLLFQLLPHIFSNLSLQISLKFTIKVKDQLFLSTFLRHRGETKGLAPLIPYPGAKGR